MQKGGRASCSKEQESNICIFIRHFAFQPLTFDSLSGQGPDNHDLVFPSLGGREGKTHSHRISDLSSGGEEKM